MLYQATAMPFMASIVFLILLSSSSALITPSHPTNRRHTSSLAATSPLFTLSANQKKPQQNSSPSSFAIPSIFNSSDSRPVVLFDGQCNLCNAGVQLVLDNDRSNLDPRGNLRVAALQSRVGKILLSRLPHHQRSSVLSMSSLDNNNGQYKSIVVTSPQQTWLNSNACIYIGKQLKGPLRYLAYLASFVPAFIRDPVYKLLSRYRKKLFGESPECRLWDDNWDTRFIDDSLFGGRSEAENANPFADPSKKVMVQDEDDGDIDVMDVSLSHNEGDVVRVISKGAPIVHTHVRGYEDSGLCSVGLVGKVSRVLNPRAYPKNVAVKFSLDGVEGGSFEAHFYPGQLKKE